VRWGRQIKEPSIWPAAPTK